MATATNGRAKKSTMKMVGDATSTEATANEAPAPTAKRAVAAKAAIKADSLPSDSQFKRCAEDYKAIADPTRLKALCTLHREPCDVGTLCAKMGLTQPAMSYHLANLRHRGIVEATRFGKRNEYSLTEKGRAIVVPVMTAMG